MKADTCSRVDSVIRAVQTGEWDEGLRAHVRGCSSCQDSRFVAQWMSEVIPAAVAGEDPLPDPHLIWLRSGSSTRESRRDPALLPIRIAEALAVPGLVAFVFSLPESIRDPAPGWLMSLARVSRDLALLWPMPPVAVVGAAALLATFALFELSSDR